MDVSHPSGCAEPQRAHQQTPQLAAQQPAPGSQPLSQPPEQVPPSQQPQDAIGEAGTHEAEIAPEQAGVSRDAPEESAPSPDAPMDVEPDGGAAAPRAETLC